LVNLPPEKERKKNTNSGEGIGQQLGVRDQPYGGKAM
jgi:hypothetical protein